jgi:addiction module HigA family antidote
MEPLRLNTADLSQKINVREETLTSLISEEIGVNADLALRLSRFFATSPELWLNGQNAWDVWSVLNGNAAKEIEAIEPVGA